MRLETEIKHLKSKLENRARQKGLYEDFGQTEVRKLKDKHIDSSKYTDEMNKKRHLIQQFNEWCMHYTN